MAITFSCAHCGKSLTTSDDKAGRKAKCPGCGEVLTVPEAESALGDDGSPEDALSPAGSDEAAEGLKTCPMCGERNERSAAACAFCGEALGEGGDEVPRGPRVFDAGDVINKSWTIYKRELATVLGAVFVSGIITAMAQVPNQVISFLSQMQIQQGQQPEPALIMISYLLLIPQNLLTWFLNIGVSKVLFKVARGKDASIGEIFSGGPYFLRMVLASIVFSLMLAGGLLAFCIGFFIVLLMFWPYVYVLIDEDPNGIDCLWRSKEITKGNWGSGLVLALAAVGINMLGALACCVGLIFTAPLTTLFFAVAYCQMTGRRVAA